MSAEARGAGVGLSAIDGARFGVVTARAPSFTAETLPEVLAFCRGHGVEMLVARCAGADLAAAHAMEAAGGRLMDVLVYFARDLRRPLPAAPAGPPLRAARADDAEAVRDLSRAAFRGYLGHYHQDRRLDRAACDEAYADWAYNSCRSREVAEEVLLAEDPRGLLGFLTLRSNSAEEREIVLNGVHPGVQRGGVYAALLHEALVRSAARGAARVVVSTQLANVPVQKAWTRAGFEPSGSFLTFHLWFDR